MKTHQPNLRLTAIPVVLVTLFTLSACNLPIPSSTPTDPALTPPSATMTDPTSSSGTAGGSCLVGNWQVTNYPEYIASLTNMFPAGTDMTINDQGSTGKIQLGFGADGAANFTADNFTEKLSIVSTASNSTMEIPIDIAMNGTSTSTYSVSGDQISFSNQDQGSLDMSISIMGSPTSMDAGIFGNQGAVTVYQYSCIDPNTLSLKVIIVNRDLAPLKFTRVP